LLDFDRALAAIAARQHCIITNHDVASLGGKRGLIQNRLKAGRWELVYPGVYRLAGVPWTYEARVFAALCYAGSGAAASHFCAARLQGIGFSRALPELSVPRGRGHRPAGVRVHTSTDLDRCGIVLRDGIAVTDPARTLLDIARYLRPTTFRRAVEDSRRAGLVSWDDLVVCLATHARKGRHGVRLLRETITAGAARDEITDTNSELIALAVLRENGFDPAVHHIVRDPADGRLVAEMDFAFVPGRVNIEINGTAHLDPVVIEKDEARDHELRTRFGWTVRRIWWEIPVYEPRRFITIVRETLASAS